jgi:hypothetical protein
VKVLVDRICEKEGLSRQKLADDLGVHIHSVSTAAYRGGIGVELVERLAKRARATAAELAAIEMAWITMKAQKPRDDALRRALDIIRALMEHTLLVESWLSERGLLEACRKVTPRDPLVGRTVNRLRQAR